LKKVAPNVGLHTSVIFNDLQKTNIQPIGENSPNLVSLIRFLSKTQSASYNASAVKIYNATSSLPRFENKNIFF
jgi:hypothetical protein